nr:uncharacterized protein LOC129255532 [Lytechinus pictus]
MSPTKRKERRHVHVQTTPMVTPEKQSNLELNKGTETVPKQSVHLGEEMPRLKRMCPFCEKCFAEKLSRHIKLNHGDQDEVKKALEAPRKERIELFSKFKQQGIYQAKNKIARETDPIFYQESRSRAKNRLIMCGNCMGFFSSRYLGRHKKNCDKESFTKAYDVPAGLLNKHDDEVEDPLFFNNVLCAFNEDNIGKICHTDNMILTVGRRLWHKEKRKFDKKVEVKKSVMTAMRRLAHLYVHFQNTEEDLGPFDASEGCGVDMFSRCNFKHLESTVKTHCQKSGENQPGEDLKYGLKTALYYLIKGACKIMKGTYLIEDKDSKADGLDRFVEVLELDFVFGDAVYAINKSQKEKLRKPNLLPLDNDVALVRDYTLTGGNHYQ